MKAFAVALGAAIFASLIVPAAAQTPGTASPQANVIAKPAPRPSYLDDAPTGLKPFYRVFGKYQLSVDATGKFAEAKNRINVAKPSADAVVAKAYLMATTFGGARLNANSIDLNGRKVTWMATQINDIPGLSGFFQSGLADVTSLIKAKVDAAPVGTISIAVTENDLEHQTAGVDGETLVVVFKTPSDPRPRTIALLFGAQKVGGDSYELLLEKPIDPASRFARAQMGLGISFSYQFNGTPQYSLVTVNGTRVSSAAGGQDDGVPAATASNGALITAGGVGDEATNPTRPDDLPLNPRSDDERYTLLPYIKKTDTKIRVDTVNPSNDDNIFFAWFELSTEANLDGDEDGDGLKDSWETSGYDHNGDGIVDVDLPAMGANPRRKDLFIAYAWMKKGSGETATHQPSAAVLDAVTAAFDRAPVTNPNQRNGVKVHWRNLGGVAHDDDLNPVWTEFDALMDPLLTEAERKIYRRMLNAHGYGGGRSSGLARGIPASDFIETLGVFSTNPGTFSQRAGTIMHELGHTLGLRHGGVDHENYKPNHLSVMGYLNQMHWVKKDGAPLLDYERFSLGDLNELALNEAAALDATAGDVALSGYGVRWVLGAKIYEKSSNAGVDVNWNRTNGIEPSIPSDINGSGALSTLRAGFVEWDNLVFAAGNVGVNAIPTASFLADPQNDLREMTEEDYLRLKRRSGN